MFFLCCSYIDDSNNVSQFKEIVDTYEKKMLSCAKSILRSYPFSDLAEDAVLEAFISIAKNMTKISSIPKEGLTEYIMVITKNAAQKIIRKEQRINSHREDWEDYDGIADDTMLNSICTEETANEIKNIIASFTEISRDIFILHCLSGMTLLQISRQMGINYNTVRKRYERAKKTLKAELIERGIVNDTEREFAE